MSDLPKAFKWNLGSVLRVIWALLSILLVESLVFGMAALPAALLWAWFLGLSPDSRWARVLVGSSAIIPSYLIFSVGLMIFSGLSTRLTGWRTPPGRSMPIGELGWDLLRWARYGVSTHLVRVFAGTFFRATPLWTFYMKLNGASLGQGVFVNSLNVTDHNLLEFGDRVVIGGGVHLSGHTVEGGMVKTAPVRLGDGVTVGVGAVVEIGVVAGPACQIGALALVPKFARLEAAETYVGIPAHRLVRNESAESEGSA